MTTVCAGWGCPSVKLIVQLTSEKYTSDLKKKNESARRLASRVRPPTVIKLLPFYVNFWLATFTFLLLSSQPNYGVLRPGASSVSMVPGSAECGTEGSSFCSARFRLARRWPRETNSFEAFRSRPGHSCLTMEGEGGPDRQVVYLPTYRTGPSESDKYVSGGTCGVVDA